jgi:hypothetical protein
MCRIDPRGGVCQEGDVGVPPRGPVLAAVDGQDLGVALERGDHRMGRGDLAELTGEVRLDLGTQVLVGEEQDEVVGQSGPHLGHHHVAQRP